ncbi:MAG: dihydrodipicolinate reductase [Deltaproteobacteria bacterium]|nr:dihydrodipicolinate reductase [Deltaproteobacteria bacterium]
MNPIPVMINGMPGNMASTVASHAQKNRRFKVIPHSLTGPEITQSEYSVDSQRFRLIKPDKREEAIEEIKKSEHQFICVDYTHPSAVNENALFYCRHHLPFVMGTTGGDRRHLKETVLSSPIPAVVAANMAKQIVGFQAMMAYAADNFPDLFKEYSITIRESHQKAKADTSGTARAMIGYFNKLGIPVVEEEIIKERDPERQKNALGVPEQYLSGHAWHTYTLVSNDQTVTFQFTHNVNGRDIYAKGTLDAVVFLSNKISEGAKGAVFTMLDVLKGNSAA